MQRSGVAVLQSVLVGRRLLTLFCAVIAGEICPVLVVWAPMAAASQEGDTAASLHAAAQERFAAAEALDNGEGGAEVEAVAAAYVEAGEQWARAVALLLETEANHLARLDLVRRALKAFDIAGSLAGQEAALRLLEAYLEGQDPSSGALEPLVRRREELRTALKPVAAEEVYKKEETVAPRSPPREARGLGLGAGLSAGLGLGGLALGVGAWTQARHGGPLYVRIAERAQAVAREHGLPPGAAENAVDYCVYADAIGDEPLQRLCVRQQAFKVMSVAGFTLAGVAAVTAVVLVAVLGRRRAQARRSSLLPVPGGLVWSGSFGQVRGGR